MTFLLIEHDLEAVLGVSERVIVMNEGRVIAAGSRPTCAPTRGWSTRT
jgi:ABC-type branched-subunit amino acid transport system ATPase component